MVQGFLLCITYVVDVYFVSYENVVRKYVVRVYDVVCTTCVYNVVRVYMCFPCACVIVSSRQKWLQAFARFWSAIVFLIYRVGAYEQSFTGIFGAWHGFCKKSVDFLILLE